MVKISVIMIDGGFRENTFGAEYFSKQNFPDNEYEVIWVEFYSWVPENVKKQKKIKIITLNNPADKVYHTSYCFNKGIELAQGELIVIPDADQVVSPDFLSKLWELHSGYEKLVAYPYRYDEIKKGDLTSFDLEELNRKCILKNPKNYGGCLSVRKKWLLAINGYEQHKILEGGFHANGLDMYTRFKNYGMAIMWAPHIKMYHPWHPYTLEPAKQYDIQLEFIEWRFKKLQYLALEGISELKNYKDFNEKKFMDDFIKKQNNTNGKETTGQNLFKRILNKF